MSRKLLIGLLVLIVVVPVVFVLGSQYLYRSVTDVDGAEQESEAATAVVEEFYRWYLAYPGNPFVEQAYRESPLVTEQFVAETDEAIEAMRTAGPGGADPILCAQDIPGDVRFQPGEMSSDRATVVVEQVWNPGTEFESVREVTVEVQKVEGEWRIRDVVCPTP